MRIALFLILSFILQPSFAKPKSTANQFLKKLSLWTNTKLTYENLWPFTEETSKAANFKSA